MHSQRQDIYKLFFTLLAFTLFSQTSVKTCNLNKLAIAYIKNDVSNE